MAAKNENGNAACVAVRERRLDGSGFSRLEAHSGVSLGTSVSTVEGALHSLQGQPRGQHTMVTSFGQWAVVVVEDGVAETLAVLSLLSGGSLGKSCEGPLNVWRLRWF